MRLNISHRKYIVSIQFLQTGSLTHLKNELLLQQLNFIEGLMSYCILTSKQTNENVKHLLPLFKEHEHLCEGLKVNFKLAIQLAKVQQVFIFSVFIK